LSLSFEEIRFLVVLLVTINLVVIVYLVVYEKARTKIRFDPRFVLIFILMILFISDFSIFVYISDLELNEEVRSFIGQAQFGITFAFIFSWIAIILLISHTFWSKYQELMWYSLLINHMTLIMIAISLIIDILPSSNLPVVLQDYVGLIITIIIGIVIDIIRYKAIKSTKTS